MDSAQKPASFYLSWMLEVLDPLPVGTHAPRSTFQIFTPCELIGRNPLHRFLTRVGLTEIADGQTVDIDRLRSYRFVGRQGRAQDIPELEHLQRPWDN
jgi:hypothetical protein